MQLAFTKMHGAGNDFVVIDARRQTLIAQGGQSLDLTPQRAREIADRRHGVGCDQIMIIEDAAAADAHFAYRILNADGGQVQQCGNGARALALYAHRTLGFDADLVMASPAGPVRARVEGDQVRVDMGPARFQPEQVPLRAVARQLTYSVCVDGRIVQFGAVSMGNPHAVVTVNDVSTAPVDELGQALQTCDAFPEGVNVGFMQIVDRQTIALRVNERGVGETLACGTGACAAVAVGAARNDLDRQVTVRLPGGELMVNCTQLDQAVWLTGPAHVAFEGHIDL